MERHAARKCEQFSTRNNGDEDDCGDPYSEKLALIYDEFLRWRDLLTHEFQSYKDSFKVFNSKAKISFR